MPYELAQSSMRPVWNPIIIIRSTLNFFFEGQAWYTLLANPALRNFASFFKTQGHLYVYALLIQQHVIFTLGQVNVAIDYENHHNWSLCLQYVIRTICSVELSSIKHILSDATIIWTKNHTTRSIQIIFKYQLWQAVSHHKSFAILLWE